MSIIEKLVQDPFTDHVEPAIKADANEFEKVVRSRRSVRIYQDQAIPEDVMRRCLDLALLAPNSSNLQPWEFYWVRDPEKKKELSRLCLNQPAATTAAELIVCVARLDTWKRNRQLLLDKFEASEEELPEAMDIYYRKIIPIAYGQGPFYLFGPIKNIIGSIIALTRPIPRATAR